MGSFGRNGAVFGWRVARGMAEPPGVSRRDAAEDDYPHRGGATLSTSTTWTVNGNRTLREAIQAANTDAVDACATGSGADTITLGAVAVTC